MKEVNAEEEQFRRRVVMNKEEKKSEENNKEEILPERVKRKSLASLLSPNDKHEVDEDQVNATSITSEAANDTDQEKPKELCPETPENLVGRLKVIQEEYPWKRINADHNVNITI